MITGQVFLLECGGIYYLYNQISGDVFRIDKPSGFGNIRAALLANEGIETTEMEMIRAENGQIRRLEVCKLSSLVGWCGTDVSSSEQRVTKSLWLYLRKTANSCI